MAEYINSTMFQEVTRSAVDQLCAQLSMSNIVVPRIDSFTDVFDFINEFETVTATLPEEYKLKILVKAFPTGRLSAWYEAEIKPLIHEPSSWKTVKNKIINRYADSEDRDRHYHRLKNINFDPSGSRKLFDFIEDIGYSFSKAFPSEQEDSKIRYVKAHLPSQVKSALIGIPECSQSSSFEEFMKGIRKYDSMRNVSSETSTTKVQHNELVTIFKDLLKDIKGEGQKIVAALKERPRSQSPNKSYQRGPQQSTSQVEKQPHHDSRSHRIRERSSSPRLRDLRHPSPHVREQSVGQNPGFTPSNVWDMARLINTLNSINGYTGPQSGAPYNPQNFNIQPRNISQTGNSQRSSSPGPTNYQNNQDSMKRYQFSPGKNEQTQTRQNNNNGGSCYEEAYYNKFGYPPQPCYACGSMHWYRHCPFISTKDQGSTKEPDPLN